MGSGPGRIVPYEANGLAVDLGHFWARTFFEELGLNIDPNGHGMIGEYPLFAFDRRLENYRGHRPDVAARLRKLLAAGIREGATWVHWH